MKNYLLLLSVFLFFSACQEKNTSNPTLEKNSDNITTKTLTLDDESTVCIKRVIQLDNQLWELRNDAPLESSLSEAVNIYLKSFEQVDFASCPPDFTRAFQEHLRAWQAITAVTDKYPDLRGKMVDLFDQLEKGADGIAMKNATAEIDATWAKVEAAMKK